MNNQLQELIPAYALNKRELDDYKKICDRDGAIIKSLMTEDNLGEVHAGGYVAKCSTTTRESFDEEKLVDLLKPLKIRGLVKRKEYIDMDILESAIYDKKISGEVLLKMDRCKNVKEVTTLRVTKAKKQEEE